MINVKKLTFDQHRGTVMYYIIAFDLYSNLQTYFHNEIVNV